MYCTVRSWEPHFFASIEICTSKYSAIVDEHFTKDYGRDNI